MRILLFRGRGVDGVWHYGNLTIVENKINHVDVGHYISNKAGAPYAYSVSPETVGQYTGVHNKIGEIAYEGDIIERNASNGRGDVRGHIVFEDGKFIIKWVGDGQWNEVLHIHLPESKIIGNVHDHTDILK